MRIKHIYSHLNALEGLKAHYPERWDEIQSIIENVDASTLITKKSKEKTMLGKLVYSPKEINACFKKEFGDRGWMENRHNYYVTSDEKHTRDIADLDYDEQGKYLQIAGLNDKKYFKSYHQIDFVLDKIAIELQLGKYAFIEFDLFVKHLRYYEMRDIDYAIEIVPTKNFQIRMSSGPGYYERALTHIIRQGRGRPALPFILLGIEPEELD